MARRVLPGESGSVEDETRVTLYSLIRHVNFLKINPEKNRYINIQTNLLRFHRLSVNYFRASREPIDCTAIRTQQTFSGGGSLNP